MKIFPVLIFVLSGLSPAFRTVAQDSSEKTIPPLQEDSSGFESVGYMDSVRRADIIHDSVAKERAAFYRDSVSRHWKGWSQFKVRSRSYNINSKMLLKKKTRAKLQYNLADFYLYLNGEPVLPPKTGYAFFSAGILCFKYNDTLLLNSGLGFKVGVGVGLKIVDKHFTGSLHANTNNQEVYKWSEDDTVYQKSLNVEPVTQSLELYNNPEYKPDEVITGEYRATYKKFYQKNEDGGDEARKYVVRIVFRCRVTGGIDSIDSLSGVNSK